MSMRVFYLLALSLSVLLSAGCQQQPGYQTKASEIFPAVAIKYAALFRMDQLPISPAFFKGQWTVLVFASSSCEDDCQHRLSLLNDVKSAQTLLVIDDLANHTQLRGLKKKYPSVAISMGTTAASIDNFLRQFEEETISMADKNKYVYLINPTPEFSYTLAVENLMAGEIDKELEYFKKTYKQE